MKQKIVVLSLLFILLLFIPNAYAYEENNILTETEFNAIYNISDYNLTYEGSQSNQVFQSNSYFTLTDLYRGTHFFDDPYIISVEGRSSGTTFLNNFNIRFIFYDDANTEIYTITKKVALLSTFQEYFHFITLEHQPNVDRIRILHTTGTTSSFRATTTRNPRIYELIEEEEEEEEEFLEISFFENITLITFIWISLIITITILINTKNLIIIKNIIIISLIFLTINLLQITPPELQGLEFLLIISFVYIIFCYYIIIQREQE